MESATAVTTACCSSQPRAGSAIAIRHRKRRATEEVRMAEPFLSEIRIMSFNFAPKGWALCNGQLLPINQNQALFSLLGTTFGGNGQTICGLQSRGDVAGDGGEYRGQPSPPEHAAVPDPELLHRAPGHLPLAHLGGR